MADKLPMSRLLHQQIAVENDSRLANLHTASLRAGQQEKAMARFEDCGLVAAHEAMVEARDWSAQAWGADGDGRDDDLVAQAVDGVVVGMREWNYFPNGLRYGEDDICMDDFADVSEEEEEDDDRDIAALQRIPAVDVMQTQYAETERVARIRRREPATKAA